MGLFIIMGTLMLSSVIVNAADPALLKEYLAAENKCLQETGVLLGDYEKTVGKENDVDMKIKCVVFCLLKELQCMRDDGTINVPNSVAYALKRSENFTESEVKNMIESCNKEMSNPCDTAHKFGHCVDKQKRMLKASKSTIV